MVEGARLESEYTAKPYRGFESLPLRQVIVASFPFWDTANWRVIKRLFRLYARLIVSWKILTALWLTPSGLFLLFAARQWLRREDED